MIRISRVFVSKAKLYIIDAHALCYRSFYAIRNLTTKDGQHTNAVYGFINTLRKILKENSPSHMAVCFDSSKKTYRQEKYSEYKIQRPSMPEELRSQIPLIKDVVKAYNLQIFECPGHEADDIIATLAKWPYKDDVEIVIVSEDKDLYQLVNEHVSMCSVRKDKILSHKDVRDILGFDPLKIADYIGLAGDQSDNIPGVMGIGEVTAKKLIAEFGSLEKMIQEVDSIQSKKVQEKIREHKDMAVLSKELATLESQVPLDFNMEDLLVKEADMERLLGLFKKLEFNRWAQELMAHYQTEESKEIKCIKEKEEFQSLIDNIQSSGEFAFLLEKCEEERGEDFFQEERYLYLSIAGETVYRLNFQDVGYIRTVLEDNRILKITYNVKSFLKALSLADFTGEMISVLSKIKGSQNFFDVKLAGYLLSSGEAAFKLNDLSWEYLKNALSEDASYSNKVVALYQMYLLMHNQLNARGLISLLENIELPLTFVLFNIESQGVNLDVPFLEELSCECEKKIDALTSQLYGIAGEEFNINSPKQLSHILFDKLKLPVIKKTKTGYSTNEDVLLTLAPKHEFPSLILEYRQLAKLKSTYIDALPKLVKQKTKRIHANFLQTGTETGRLSSRNPNLQNIPIRTELGRRVRKAFIPFDKDSLLMKADYSQIELRILAHLSNDEELKKAFEGNQDVHRYTASLIFDIAEGKVTTEMRNTAKRVNFGIIYGMSAFGLAKDLNIFQDEARDFIDRYFLRYKKVKLFMDETIKLCESQGYVTTLLGRRRDIPNINSKNGPIKQFAQRQAINTPVQGSAADLIKLAMINVAKEMEDKQFQSAMIITVHDELVFNIKKDELADMTTLVREKMENSFSLSIPIKVSIKAGTNWLDMEEVVF